MSILQALDRYYARMAARGEAEAPGWSREKISFAIVVDGVGQPVDVQDLRETSGKRAAPRQLEVPAAVKRTAGVAPNLLWDKTSYVLGRTGNDESPNPENAAKAAKRTADEHAKFRDEHANLLRDSADDGLVALRRFLETWTPERFDAPPFDAEMLDANVVFRLSGDHGFIHERPAAKRLIAARNTAEGASAVCLITGDEAPVERLHPTIKGVQGAQSSGAALVSFNLDAFESYGKEQGDNAPTSQPAAFRYGAALNRMLDRGSGNRLARPLGDTTIVFWADAESEEKAAAAEDVFNLMFAPPANAGDDESLERDAEQAAKLRDALMDFAKGRPVAEPKLNLARGVKFHIVGLAPNAARLSVRFWVTDDFEAFAQRLSDHDCDLRIEPTPWRARPPSVSRLLVKTTALQEKFDNIPPLLAGEVTRAVLTGALYPRTLLSATLMRLRAGDDASTGWHAAAIRAVLARLYRFGFESEEPPMALNPDNPNIAYQLGRLFAVYERLQETALGNVNATIRDKYYGAFSATPASVFSLIDRGAQNHLAKVRKESPGLHHWYEKTLGEIFVKIDDGFPRSLKLEDQGRFALGYYHQRWAKADKSAPEVESQNEENNG